MKFDYDKWWTLKSLAEYFECDWWEVPTKSNGIITETFKIMLKEALGKREASPKIYEFTIKGYDGYLKDTGDGISVTRTCFKVVRPMTLIDLRTLR